MPEENFLRMIQLAEEFFETKNDPDQLAVDESIIERLLEIHQATVGEERNDQGPIAWMIVIPTTYAVMQKFLSGEINEKELLDNTPVHAEYNAIYLCSALVLPEFRRKGLAKKLACRSIKAIQQDHPITMLYYWGFSDEGKQLAETIAEEMGLRLLNKTAGVKPAATII